MHITNLLLQFCILITKSNLLTSDIYNKDITYNTLAHAKTVTYNEYAEYDRNFITFVRAVRDTNYILPIHNKAQCIEFVKKVVTIMDINKYINEEWCWEKEDWNSSGDDDESGSGSNGDDESGSGSNGDDESGSGSNDNVHENTCDRLLCYNCKQVTSYIYEMLINNMDTIYTQSDILDICKMLTSEEEIINPVNQTTNYTCPEYESSSDSQVDKTNLQIGIFSVIGSGIIITIIGVVKYLCKPVDPGFRLTMA
jgi:hypothetical protein